MADIAKIVEQLSGLTVLEAAELVKELEEKWGVSAAAPVAVAAAGGGESADAGAAEEKTEFDVVLVSDGGKKIQVIKEVRAITALGLKEAKGELSRVQALLALGLPADFALYSGDDATARASIELGFHGDISVTANVAPSLMHRMCAAARAGNAAEAAALDAKLALLHRDLFLEPNPIPVKWALHHMGRIPPGLRLPMVPMSADIQPRIIAALQAAEVIA